MSIPQLHIQQHFLRFTSRDVLNYLYLPLSCVNNYFACETCHCYWHFVCHLTKYVGTGNTPLKNSLLSTYLEVHQHRRNKTNIPSYHLFSIPTKLYQRTCGGIMLSPIANYGSKEMKKLKCSLCIALQRVLYDL